MKTLKNATQKNAIVNPDYLTVAQINELLRHHTLFYFDGLEISYDEVNNYNVSDFTFRIALSRTKELKVIYSKEYECYLTVAIPCDDVYSVNEYIVIDL